MFGKLQQVFHENQTVRDEEGPRIVQLFLEVEGLEAEEIKQYIRFIGDRRLQQINLEPVFGAKKNPLPWMDEMMNGAEHTNFFENRSTEYSKASTEGSWEEVFSNDVFSGNYGERIDSSNNSEAA